MCARRVLMAGVSLRIALHRKKLGDLFVAMVELSAHLLHDLLLLFESLAELF